MEKIILVAYINVKDMPISRTVEILQSARENLDPKDDSILFFVVPVTEHDNKIECLNPKLVSEQDFLEAKKALVIIQEKLNSLYFQ